MKRSKNLKPIFASSAILLVSVLLFLFFFKKESTEIFNQVTEPLKENKEVRLLFVGDIMMDRSIKIKVNREGGGDYLFPFEYIKNTLQDADLLFGNLEGPISERGIRRGSMYSFRMAPQVAGALGTVGFDILSMANNHMGDYGHEAMEDTFMHLKNSQIQYVGAGYSETEALAPIVIEKKGLKIGFLAFSDVGPNWMQAGENTSGIAIAEENALTEAIMNARPLADVLVVSFHFGDEYKTHSNARQQHLARLSIDSGADIVVGHHPHVAEEIEMYNKGVIAYSLGNFIFDQAFSPDTKEALMLEVVYKNGVRADVNPIKIRFNEHFQPMLQ